MNLDIVDTADGLDLGLAESSVGKAANVLSIQLGSLEYIPLFGVDMRYFLESPYQFQNESFKAYLVERLVKHQIGVNQITETINSLYVQLETSVDSLDQTQKGFIK